MRRQGFTLVEVMISLGVMTIGAMALLAMQQQVTRANVRAREITVATQIAQNVIERLKLESLAWTNVTAAPATDLIDAPLLLQITTSTAGQFMTLPTRQSTLNGATVTLSNAFTFGGTDFEFAPNPTTQDQTSLRFCASYRLSWVQTNNRAIRADVRVFWAKDGTGADIVRDFPLCADNGTSLMPGQPMFDQYHVVYLSTVLRPSA